jgi:hypothetical protein
MPARSEKQRRFLYARFGSAWVKKHHFDNPGKLPRTVGSERRRRRRKALMRRLGG